MDDGEEGHSFTWWQPPPDTSPYFEHRRDKFYDFERNLCWPKNEGDFKLETNLARLAADRVKMNQSQAGGGSPKKEEPHEDDEPSSLPATTPQPSGHPNLYVEDEEKEVVEVEIGEEEEEEVPLVARRGVQPAPPPVTAVAAPPASQRTIVIPSTAPSVLGKRKEHPVLVTPEPSQSFPPTPAPETAPRPVHFTTTLQLATTATETSEAESTPVPPATPRQVEEAQHQRLLRDVDYTTRHGAPEGAINLCEHGTARFYQDAAQLLKSGKAVAWALMFTDGSTSFRVAKKSSRKTKHAEEVEEASESQDEETPLGIGFALDDKLCFLPLQEKQGTRVMMSHRWGFLSEFLALGSPKVGHNTQQILRILYSLHPPLREVDCKNFVDTRIGGWVLRPANNRADPFTYDALLQQYLDIFDNARDAQEPKSVFSRDLGLLLPLAEKILGLITEQGMLDVFEGQELYLPPILAAMENAGISVDLDKLTANRVELQQRIALLEQRAEEWAGKKFLLSSPKQVADVLYNQLKLAPPSTPGQGKGVSQSPKKHPTTSEEALLALQEKHALPGIILEHRHLNKLLRSYIDPFVVHANKRNETASGIPRIYGRWEQVTATGRLASHDPNLQNLPRPESLDFFLDGVECIIPLNLRDSFVAQPGMVFVSADYSQLEMRLLAHISQEAALLQFFSDGHDFFKLVGSRLWGKPSAQVDDKERELAKRVCYGVMYGAGAASLATDLKISPAKARVFVERFLAQFPAVNRWISDTKRQAHKEGYVRTLFGRRRLLPDIHSTSKEICAAAERQAVNSIIQGTASDLVKQAMLAIDVHLRAQKMKSRLILQVHDELIYETPVDEIEAMVALLQRCMEEAAKLDLPLPVSVQVGERIGSLQPYSPGGAESTASTQKVATTAESDTGGAEASDAPLHSDREEMAPAPAPAPRELKIPVSASQPAPPRRPMPVQNVRPAAPLRAPEAAGSAPVMRPPASQPPLPASAPSTVSNRPPPRFGSGSSQPAAPTRPAGASAPAPPPARSGMPPASSAPSRGPPMMTYASPATAPLRPAALTPASPAPSASPHLLTPLLTAAVKREDEESSLNEDSFSMEEPPVEEEEEEGGDYLGVTGQVLEAGDVEYPHDDVVSQGPDEDFSMPEEDVELDGIDHDLYEDHTLS